MTPIPLTKRSATRSVDTCAAAPAIRPSSRRSGPRHRAASWAAPLADLRHTTLAGEVLATFQRSAYLDLGGRIVALASVELERGPLTITVPDFATVREYIATGRVVADSGLLHLGAIAVDLRGAEVWDPSLPRIPADAGWTASAVVVDELWSAAPIGSGVAPLGPAAASDPPPAPRPRRCQGSAARRAPSWTGRDRTAAR